MTEQEWLASTDLAVMLDFLRPHTVHTGGGRGYTTDNLASDRKLRLFATACCRQVWDAVTCPRCKGDGKFGGVFMSPSEPEALDPCPDCRGTGRVGGLTDTRDRRAVEIAERYADGKATEVEMLSASREIAYAVAGTSPCRAARFCGFTSASVAARRAAQHCGCPPAAQAALLRDIFGNPWNPRSLWCPKCGGSGFSGQGSGYGDVCDECGGQRTTPESAAIEQWLRWNDGAVPRIARAIYEERRWQDMPILADALLDAGCDDEDILRHCRGRQRCPWADPDPAIDHGGKTPAEMACPCNGTGWRPLATTHVRGCWVIDLVLGKE